jgi:hypothetical protein
MSRLRVGSEKQSGGAPFRNHHALGGRLGPRWNAP